MRLIVFFSGDSHAGCTTVAGAVAHELSAKGHKTLLIHASGKLSLSYTSRELCHSIDDIRASLISDRFNSTELRQIAEPSGNLDILGDVRNSYTSKLFPLETYERIKLAADEYSYIVVDAGNRMELAMNISALNTADEIYFVLSQSPCCIGRFREMDDYILRQVQCDFKIILNKFSRDFAFYRKGEIEAMIDRKIDFVIPNVDYGLYAEFEKRNALITKGGKRVLNGITDGILQEHSRVRSRGFFTRGIFRESKAK